MKQTAGNGSGPAKLASERDYQRPGFRHRLFRFAKRGVHAIAWQFRLLEYVLPVVEREINSTVRVPLRKRPWLYRHGFLAEAWVIYRLDRNSPDLYLTDIERFVGTRLINGPPGVLLDDKLLFARLFDGPLAQYAPPLFGVLSGGRVKPVKVGAPDSSLEELLARERSLAVKPAGGGGGVGLSFLSVDPDGVVRCNCEVQEPDEIERLARRCEGHMVTGFVPQHPALAGLYERTTNTIRIVTMQDSETEPFIAASVLRIGTSASEPADSWSSGGMCAEVDLETGRLSQAAGFPVATDRIPWFARHPESGAQIEGTVMPNWEAVKEGILSVARAFPFLRYVGWDVVVTEDGFRIIEGNNYSGSLFLQAHRPMLADPRVADYFRRHGVLKSRWRRSRRNSPHRG